MKALFGSGTQTITTKKPLIFKLKLLTENIRQEVCSVRQEGSILLENIKTEKELQEAIDDKYDRLQHKVQKYIEEMRFQANLRIPKKPENEEDQNAQKKYQEDVEKFEHWFDQVVTYLSLLTNSLAEVIEKIGTFYEKLWTECKDDIEAFNKRADKFEKKLQKGFDNILKQLNNLNQCFAVI